VCNNAVGRVLDGRVEKYVGPITRPARRRAPGGLFDYSVGSVDVVEMMVAGATDREFTDGGVQALAMQTNHTVTMMMPPFDFKIEDDFDEQQLKAYARCDEGASRRPSVGPRDTGSHRQRCQLAVCS